MQLLWAKSPLTAEQVREAYPRPLKDSTIRTILRRLEEKGYVQREPQGRTFLYRGVEAPQRVGLRAVRQALDRFLNGSVEQLLTGLVENEVVDGAELKRLADKIARTRKNKEK